MKNELVLNPAAGQPATMSSLEISFLVESRHDSVKRSIERLAEKGVIQHPPMVEVKNSQGQLVWVYQLEKRDTFVIVAQLSPEFTARVVDRWQELEALAPKPAELSRMEHGIAIAAEQEKLIAIEQRDEAIRTKAQIGDKKVATAMATASALSEKVSKLQDELGQNQLHATMIAVENATKRIFGNQGWRPLKKYCDENGLQSKDVADARYGSVKAWPASAWKSVYDIVLEKIFPGSKTK